MSEVNPAERLPSTTDYDTTNIVVGALFTVYDSSPQLLSPHELMDQVYKSTNYNASSVVVVVDKLFKKNFLMKSDEKTSFGTNGLWLLEDAFAHSEETVDSMKLAEQILARQKFLFNVEQEILRRRFVDATINQMTDEHRVPDEVLIRIARYLSIGSSSKKDGY